MGRGSGILKDKLLSVSLVQGSAVHYPNKTEMSVARGVEENMLLYSTIILKNITRSNWCGVGGLILAGQHVNTESSIDPWSPHAMVGFSLLVVRFPPNSTSIRGNRSNTPPPMVSVELSCTPKAVNSPLAKQYYCDSIIA